MAGTTIPIPFAPIIEWSAAQGVMFSATLLGDAVLAMPTGLIPGAYIIYVTQDASGGHKLTFANGYRARLGVLPVLSSSPNAIDILTLVSDGINIDVSIWLNSEPL